MRLPEELHRWVERQVYQDMAIRESELRMMVRARPRWLPERAWRWLSDPVVKRAIDRLNALVLAEAPGRYLIYRLPDTEPEETL